MTHKIPQYILYVNGSVWGRYLTREDANETADRCKAKGRKVSIVEQASL